MFFGAAVLLFYLHLIFTFLSYSHSMLLSSYTHLLVLLPLHVLIILYSPSCPTPTPCYYHLIFTFLSYSHSMLLSSYIHLLVLLPLQVLIILYSPSCPTPAPCYYHLLFIHLLLFYIHPLVLLPLHVIIIPSFSFPFLLLLLLSHFPSSPLSTLYYSLPPPNNPTPSPLHLPFPSLPHPALLQFTTVIVYLVYLEKKQILIEENKQQMRNKSSITLIV